MEYSLSIRQDNLEPYVDIEHDLQEKLNGLFTFILRVNNGKIVDYSVLEFVDARTKYLRLKEIIREELTFIHYTNGGTENPAVWPNDGQLSD